MAIGTPSGNSLVQAASATFVEATIAVSVADTLFVVSLSENAAGGAPPAHSVTDQTNSETITNQYQWSFTDEGGMGIWKLEVATGATKTIRFSNSET